MLSSEMAFIVRVLCSILVAMLLITLFTYLALIFFRLSVDIDGGDVFLPYKKHSMKQLKDKEDQYYYA